MRATMCSKTTTWRGDTQPCQLSAWLNGSTCYAHTSPEERIARREHRALVERYRHLAPAIIVELRSVIYDLCAEIIRLRPEAARKETAGPAMERAEAALRGLDRLGDPDATDDAEDVAARLNRP